jgi:hypothetical protein
MRFPFEMELINYQKFVVHFAENETSEVDVLEALQSHTAKMQRDLVEARRMFEFGSQDGGYVWAIAWSLYMKLLAWLPMRRTKLIRNLFNDPNVIVAQ